MTDPTERNDAGSVLARAAAIVFTLTVISRLLGFLRDAVFAAVFGAGDDLDAFFVAQGVPNIIIALIATSTATTMVPLVSSHLARSQSARASAIFSSVTNVTVGAVAVGSVLLGLAAEPIVAIMAPGFDSATHDLAVELTRIVLVAAVFVALMNLMAAGLQSARVFLWPAAVGIPFNIVMILVALIFGHRYGVRAIAVVSSLLRWSE